MLDLIASLYRSTTDWVLNHPWSSVTVGIPLAGVLIIGVIKRVRKRPRIPLMDYKDGVAYIHMFPRNYSKKVINISPFAIKVETWCRMNNVPYEVVETSRFSTKENQMPWLILDGHETADSSVIISTLREYFKVDEPNLTEAQLGIQWSVSRVLDDLFVVLYFWYRYFHRGTEFRKYFRITTFSKPMSNFIAKSIGKTLNDRGRKMGFARYGYERIVELGENDLLSIEHILGDNDFLFGKTPSDADAVVFAHMTQILCPDLDYPWKKYIQKSCPRLQGHFKRMMERYWSDWDSMIDTDTFE